MTQTPKTDFFYWDDAPEKGEVDDPTTEFGAWFADRTRNWLHASSCVDHQLDYDSRGECPFCEEVR